MTEFTLAVIKPGAVERGVVGEILRFVRSRYEVKSVEMRQWSRDFAEKFYNEHRGKTFFNGLCQHASSGPCAEVVLFGPDVANRWRQNIGPTDPQDDAGKKIFPGLRQVYGLGLPDNALHGSADAQDAERELALVGFLKDRV